MIFDILTIFPNYFKSPLDESLLRKAMEKGILSIRIHDLRQFALDRHRMMDDYPYGGGRGMIMKPEPVIRAVEEIKAQYPEGRTILLTPQGERFHQGLARELSTHRHWILICGRYEGLDDRIRESVVDREISIGDYVLNGGEIAALVIIEATCRYLPGFLGDGKAVEEDSFSSGLLEYPQFTRPPIYRGLAVPEVLLSGNHAAIERWRRQESLRRTLQRRPDLLEKANLTEEDRAFLAEIRKEETRFPKELPEN
jgi:tRNA (guanine37-N1)-methyltransferase